MTEPTAPQDIDEVILLLQREGIVLVKDKSAQVGTRTISYADLVQVNRIVLKLLNGWDTIWKCKPHITKTGQFVLRYRLKHLPSKTEEKGNWPLKLSDQPQRMGSEVSYGRRYALLAVTGVVSDEEDDDGKSAGEEPKPRQTRQVKRANGPEPAAETEADRAAKAFARLHILWKELGMDRDAALMWSDETLDRQTPLKSSTELTPAEVTTLVTAADKLKKERGIEG